MYIYRNCHNFQVNNLNSMTKSWLRWLNITHYDIYDDTLSIKKSIKTHPRQIKVITRTSGEKKTSGEFRISVRVIGFSCSGVSLIIFFVARTVNSLSTPFMGNYTLKVSLIDLLKEQFRVWFFTYLIRTKFRYIRPC